MDEYEIEITETYQRQITVTAPNENVAIKMVKQKYNVGSIVLTADYYVDTEFSLVGEVWNNYII